jgi:hypothetical protein
MILLALLLASLTAQPIQLDRGPLPLEQAFAQKAEVGEAAFARDVEAAVEALIERTSRTGRCESPPETAAAAQLQLVRRTSDPKTFAASKAAAEAALAKRRELRTAYLGGEAVAPPYGLVGRMVRRAKTEPDARVAELYRRAAEDQFSRIDTLTVRPFRGPGVHTTWEQGLDEGALAYVDAIVSGEWCRMDVSNAAWLKADLRKHGWYRVSTYGADADRAAWLMVQHARHDLKFQEEVLTMLEALWQSGETRGANFAMLYDQTATYRGRPGRFGVNGKCGAGGVWTPEPQEDLAETDKWRAKAGLEPLADYIASSSRGC